VSLRLSAASPKLFSPFLSTKPSIPLSATLRDEFGYAANDKRPADARTIGRAFRNLNQEVGSRACKTFVGGIVGVAARGVAIEGAAVIPVSGKPSSILLDKSDSRLSDGRRRLGCIAH